MRLDITHIILPLMGYPIYNIYAYYLIMH